MQQNQQQRALATRTACDRCRERKLRCLRSQGQGDGACVRCARAGASCVTGAPRPLGRCRASLSEAVHRRPRHSVFVSAAPSRSASRVSLPAASMPRGPEEPETTSITGLPHEGSVALSPTRDSEGSFKCFRGPVTAETPDDAVIDALDLGFPNDNDDATALSALFGVSNTGAFPMELEADFRELYGGDGGDQPASSKSLSAPPDTHNPSPCVDPAFLLRSLPAGGAALDNANRLPPEQPSPGPGSNALVRLARLNQCIAHQLSRMDTFVMGIPSPALLDSCVASVADLQVNPILQALESTAELAAVIRQVISPVQDHGSSSTSSSSPPSMPVVLMCLSGHIQLLQVYDTIFLHVHRFLGGLHDILGFFEGLPGLTHISGLPPIKGDLYIKIMIQVAQHNLGSVEKALALPADLCLSAQRASSRGLLSYVDSLDPFQSIMGQACRPSEKSGRALVASVRIRIGNILGLLRDDC
ncbi:uncharacterized protein GLRG_10154 [Colletotrichum graminicola M1.001]|uniref:Zn(2)-C6 fungal-type domain-containing protein n=1 Tax=Colletotrichum graminicola (strain M1.001 / M2 / FGSC 10212) TaxID=645133 RepID=E3QVX2_COLGM|nr:uncharacterized protein GLRG_10154 [Colletotrichum graminicola M1.001]EFQ35010.1 hypothetical protein GLRG_10154 [Colletotrichum graminicola M1.001]